MQAMARLVAILLVALAVTASALAFPEKKDCGCVGAKHEKNHNPLFGGASDLPMRVTPRNHAPAFSAMAVVDQKVRKRDASCSLRCIDSCFFGVVQFSKINLQQYLTAGKWVVLLFYPFDFTFVVSHQLALSRGFAAHGCDCCCFLSAQCPTEIISVSARVHVRSLPPSVCPGV